jgi:hypothetical protein
VAYPRCPMTYGTFCRPRLAAEAFLGSRGKSLNGDRAELLSYPAAPPATATPPERPEKGTAGSWRRPQDTGHAAVARSGNQVVARSAFIHRILAPEEITVQHGEPGPPDAATRQRDCDNVQS